MREFLYCPTLNNLKHTATPSGSRLVQQAKGAKNSDRTVIGLAAVCGNEDGVGDVCAFNAFDSAISDFKAGRSRAKFLWQHDSSQPPVGEILDLKMLSRHELPDQLRSNPEVTGALQVTRKYFSDYFADRVYQGVVAGSISEMSFAFSVLDFHYDDRGGTKVRVLDSIELFDCADVCYGANALTMASVKAPTILNDAKIKQKKETADLIRRSKELQAQVEYADPMVKWKRVRGNVERTLKRSSSTPKTDIFRATLLRSELESLKARARAAGVNI